MSTKNILPALALSFTLLVGCSETQPDKAASETQAPSANDMFTYQDPRAGYTPRTDLCAVPPCKTDAEVSSEPAEM